ncbi:MAG: nuclear transport factor 2 family protein, partial [Granulosicoccus sp.]
NAEIFGHGCTSMAAFDFFEVHEDGRLTAHWDAMTCEQEPNASGRLIADGISEITDLERTGENKAKLTAAFDAFINGTPEEAFTALETYFHADYKQHNPDGSDGIEGFLAAQMSAEVTPRWQFTKLHKIVGEGNYLLAISEGNHVGAHSVFYDLVRFEDGKIAEHWDVIQAVPTEGLANENTMFNFN